jgi:hypothetical protein
MVTLQTEEKDIIATQKSDEKLLLILEDESSNLFIDFPDFEKVIDDCVKEFGAEYTAKLIVFARDNNFTRTLCLEASVILVKYLKEAHFAKYFFSKRINGKGGIIREVRDITKIVNFYLGYEAHRREQISIKDISYPNCMRKGIRSALENFTMSEFYEYNQAMSSKWINLKDIIKYFHPNPQKSVATIKMSVTDYIECIGNSVKFAKEIEKVKSESVDGICEIDAFHAVLYDLLDYSTINNYYEIKKFNMDNVNIEEIRQEIEQVDLNCVTF